jgi:hypothetical protein
MTIWRVLGSLAFAALVVAQPANKLYPGARLDPAGTQEARTALPQPDVEVTVYTTSDSFDKVYAYFKKTAREFKAIGSRARRLPNGQELKDAFFILDEAVSLADSKFWVKLQRPYLGQYGLARNGGGQDQIRDVTALIVTKKK